MYQKFYKERYLEFIKTFQDEANLRLEIPQNHYTKNLPNYTNLNKKISIQLQDGK